jgi:sugar lactone lactonase YvrE
VIPTSPRRRQLLAAGLTAGIGSVAGCTQLLEAPELTVETVVSVPGDPVPENMAFDNDGNLYFGISAGELRRLPSDRVGETGLTLDDTEQLATLPSAFGVETAPDGTVYVAAANEADLSGIWEVQTDSNPSQFVGMSGFPNDILFDADRDRLLVTDSDDGVVSALGTDRSQSTWLEDDRLDTEGVGANGITRDEAGDIYVAVSQTADDTGRLLRVPVAEDGSAGEATLLFEGSEILGADGITANDGSIYVAANSQNRIVEIESDGRESTVVTADDGLVFPSDVLFGPDDWLYICNFAAQSPEDAAILRTEL